MNLARLALVALAVAWLGCGGRGGAPETAGAALRPPAPDAPLLELLPSGPDLVVELDIARLRDSEALGELVASLRREAAEGRGIDLLAADELLLASYQIGRDSATTLTLVRGDGVSAIDGAEILAERTAAIGPPELVGLAAGVVAGEEGSAATDERLLELRDAAIPDAAPGAALRVSGDLDFDARVGLSALLSLSEVPVAISIWGDVVDDLAVVALLGAESVEEARSLADAAGAFRERAASMAPVARYGLAPAVADARIDVEGATVRVTVVVPPARLERAIHALVRDVTVAPQEFP